jgi:hypothetical protein
MLTELKKSLVMDHLHCVMEMRENGVYQKYHIML